MLNTLRKKIALVGSAPSSCRLAPFDNPEWFIFGCSPGAYGACGNRAHSWMENHRWEPQVPGVLGTGQPWFSPEYVEYLTRFAGDVWMTEPLPPEIPHARPLPIDYLLDKYGPYFFTSSLSWMFAIALETPGVEEIGLWGVDMAANEEWNQQRPGCQYFITLAMQRGIKVTVPPESDLLQPAYFYGVSENSPMMIKLTARRYELQQRLNAAEQRMSQARDEGMFLRGAIDDINYMVNTWVSFQSFVEPKMGATGNEVRAEKLAPENKHTGIEKLKARVVDDPLAYLNEVAKHF